MYKSCFRRFENLKTFNSIWNSLSNGRYTKVPSKTTSSLVLSDCEIQNFDLTTKMSNISSHFRWNIRRKKNQKKILHEKLSPEKVATLEHWHGASKQSEVFVIFDCPVTLDVSGNNFPFWLSAIAWAQFLIRQKRKNKTRVIICIFQFGLDLFVFSSNIQTFYIFIVGRKKNAKNFKLWKINGFHDDESYLRKYCLGWSRGKHESEWWVISRIWPKDFIEPEKG